MSCADQSRPLTDTTPIRAPARAWLRWPGKALRWCGRVMESRRQRRALLELEPHQLKDIGLTREQALALANKLFWTRA
jgi:uncharacterized protein YjiS (DUF1127 family)